MVGFRNRRESGPSFCRWPAKPAWKLWSSGDFCNPMQPLGFGVLIGFRLLRRFRVWGHDGKDPAGAVLRMRDCRELPWKPDYDQSTKQKW